MLAPVVVDVVTHEATPAQVDALFEACTRAAEHTPCVPRGEEIPDEASSAVALVFFVSETDVRIQVRLMEEDRWYVRHLSFDPEDDALEIFTAVGFMTGTLAWQVQSGEATDTETAPVQPEETPPPPPAKPKPPPPRPPPAPPSRPAPEEEAQRPFSWHIDAAVVFDRGRGQWWRLGGLGRLDWTHESGLGAFVSLRYTRTPPQDIREAQGRERVFTGTARWMSAEVGPSYTHWLTRRWLVTPRLGLVGEQFYFFAVGQEGGRRAQQGQHLWRMGLRAGAKTAWMVSRALGVHLGLDVTFPFESLATDTMVGNAIVPVVYAREIRTEVGLGPTLVF